MNMKVSHLDNTSGVDLDRNQKMFDRIKEVKASYKTDLSDAIRQQLEEVAREEPKETRDAVRVALLKVHERITNLIF